MAFQIKANPTFDMALTLVGQGREQKLNLVVKHMTAKAYLEMLEKVRKEELSTADAILTFTESWDADMELGKKAVELLAQHQPGADWAILTGYRDALQVARKGNA